jgi:pyruvate,water dikinase
MKWHKLEQFRDPGIPKLNNLRIAAEAGLRVPPTWWLSADRLLRPGRIVPPSRLHTGPWIVRSASPSEDTANGSNAGQFLSLPVHVAAHLPVAVRRVCASLPRDEQGRRLGAIFIQPFLTAQEAGVVFFDGFYYERAQARRRNLTLTNGHARGQVQRGHLERGEAWSDWLAQVHSAFNNPPRATRPLDIEFARDEQGYILLQVRPAQFPVERNYTCTLLNHREILGDQPSAWMVSAFVEAGQDTSYLAAADPALAGWDDVYAVELAERAWGNQSMWYRWLDHYGLPRRLVTHTLGGDDVPPEKSRIRWSRLLRRLPRLGLFVWQSLVHLATGVRHDLIRLDHAIDRASNLTDLHAATAFAMNFSVHTNFAIDIFLAPLSEIWRPGHGKVVTQQMMDEYEQNRALPLHQREAALDHWLTRYGHRGPLESDPMQPRFAELRDVLLQDLRISTDRPVTSVIRKESLGRRFLNAICRPLFYLDECRESYRDALMRRWQPLRKRILAEAHKLVDDGKLDHVEDVFWLSGRELARAGDYRAAIAARRARLRAIENIELPLTATRDQIQALTRHVEMPQIPANDGTFFRGVPLSPAVVEGRALRANGLVSLLDEIRQHPETIAADTILVVPALEPSWAVVFPRVAGVVSELGGELSHASILLREVRKPAIVSCTGICRRVHTGTRLRLDGGRGVVALL